MASSSHLRWSPDRAAEADSVSLTTSMNSSSSLLSGTMRSRAWVRRSSQERRNSAGDKTSKNDSKLTPFYLRWSFGNNKNIPVSNLTRVKRPLLFYTSCHAGVLYDYKAKEMRLLQGHHNPVSSIASDNAGKWLVTADAGPDNVVIVWDSELCLPVNTLFNPFPFFGTKAVGISPDAKYLVAVSDEPIPKTAFWLWTVGKDIPDATAKMPGDFGPIHNIVFNSDEPEEFMVTSDENVAFFIWDSYELTLEFRQPVFTKRKVGNFIESVYLPELNEALTCTSKGYVLMWGPGKNATTHTAIKKRLVKEIRLQKEGITCIRSVFTTSVKDSNDDDLKRVVVTGNSHGHVRFYDQQLRLLFWCQSFSLDPIVSVDFHLEAALIQVKDPLDVDSMSTFNTSRSSTERGKSPVQTPKRAVGSANTNTSVCSSPRLHLVLEDRSEEYETVYANLVPSDASLQRRPFVVRDFVVSTTTGQISLVNFLANELQQLLSSPESNVSAIDVHPEQPYVVLGDELGHLRMYNYLSKDLLLEQKLPPEHTGDATLIRSLKFSPSGVYLVCGMYDGALWVLDPNLLTPLFTPPFRHVTSAITKICITPDSQYIAHIDNNMCTSLYRSPDKTGKELIYLGRQRAHYKEVRDILFGEHVDHEGDEVEDAPRLFTLGDDKVLVEYDVANSHPDELLIYNLERIEQSAMPLCMAWYPMFTVEKFLLTSNSEYKYKVLNDSTKMCRKTALTAMFDSPVCHIKILGSLTRPSHDKAYMVFATDKQIGIQMLPVDGNPFKSVGMVGHPIKIQHLRVSSDDKYLFTVGGDDSSVLLWQINVRAVDVMTRIGGEGVNPYYCLIEGGQNGWLFQEMQDFFYYAQILHQGESMPTTRQVSDKIPLCELPDLMRAIGFYPSEYEIENMVHEVHYSKYAHTGQEEEYINFEDFVRLYINHQPARGVSVNTLKQAFDTFADSKDGEKSISRDSFLAMLQERGECFSKEQAVKYLNVLAPKEHKRTLIKDPDMPGESDSQEIAYQRIPEKFYFTMFADDILGITYTTPDLKSGVGLKFNP